MGLGILGLWGGGYGSGEAGRMRGRMMWEGKTGWGRQVRENKMRRTLDDATIRCDAIGRRLAL